MKKTIIAILIVFIIAAIVSIYFLTKDITDVEFKEKIIKFLISLIIYSSLASIIVSYKNQRYVKKTVKKVIGERFGKIKYVPDSYSDTDSGSRKYSGYSSAKYKFIINNKTYTKRIFFNENDTIPEKLELFYRIGKKDINKTVKTTLYKGNIEIIVVLILMFITSYLIFK